jgi:tetratricopeptide (TPR) repeat protein
MKNPATTPPAADRYAHLPGCFVAAPAVALAVARAERQLRCLGAIATRTRERKNTKRPQRRPLGRRFGLRLRRWCWRGCWGCLLVVQAVALVHSGIRKWATSEHLWCRQAAAPPGGFSARRGGPFAGAAGVVGAAKKSWWHWYQRPDVLSLYNLGRMLQQPPQSLSPPSSSSATAAAIRERRREGAVAAYVAALEADPTHGGAWNNLGILLESGAGPEPPAVASMKELHSDDEDDSHGAAGPGDSDLEGRRLQRVLRGALSANDAETSTMTTTTTPMMPMTRRGAAEACFRRAASLHSATHAKAHNNLGRLLYGRGAHAAAADRYRAAVRVSPGYATAWHNLGLVLSRLEDDGVVVFGDGGGGSSGSGGSAGDGASSGAEESSEGEGDAAQCFLRALKALEARGGSAPDRAEELIAAGDAKLNRGFRAWRRFRRSQQQRQRGLLLQEDEGESEIEAVRIRQLLEGAAGHFAAVLEGPIAAELSVSAAGQRATRRAIERAVEARAVLRGMQ